MSDINVILADHPGLGRVRLCDCNAIHLSVGPVTITMAPEAFAQTVILVRNAMEQLAIIHDSRQEEQNSHQTGQTMLSQFTH